MSRKTRSSHVHLFQRRNDILLDLPEAITSLILKKEHAKVLKLKEVLFRWKILLKKKCTREFAHFLWRQSSVICKKEGKAR